MMETFAFIFGVVVGLYLLLEIVIHLRTGRSWLDTFDEMNGKPRDWTDDGERKNLR